MNSIPSDLISIEVMVFAVLREESLTGAQSLFKVIFYSLQSIGSASRASFQHLLTLGDLVLVFVSANALI